MGCHHQPGLLFFAGHALLVNAGILGLVAVQSCGLETVIGQRIYGLGWGAIIGAFLAYFGSANLASNYRTDPESRPSCPRCDHELCPRPWSL